MTDLLFKKQEETTEETCIRLYKEGLQIIDIRTALKIGKNKLYYILKSNKVPIRPASTKKEKDILKLYEEGLSIRQIVKKLDCGRNTVRDVLKRNNVEKRKHEKKYKIDDTVLDNIDTPEKAYFMGWMYSGGTIGERDDTFALGIPGDQKYILEKLGSIFSKDDLVKCYERKIYKCGSYATLTIFNKKLKKILLELGLNTGVKNNIEFPKWLDEKLYSHFVRGLLDSKGFIYFNGRKSFILRITASHNIINYLFEFIKNKFNFEFFTKEFTENTSNILYRRQEGLKLFLDWVYQDIGEFYLKERYDEYLKFLEVYKYLKELKEERKINRQVRSHCSKEIYKTTKENGGTKERPTFKALPYTVQEFRDNITNQFEWWMTWKNRGNYKKSEWDDNDPSTWRWQIDHIIPQSDLPYKSVFEENFYKTWDLSNLRPLSAKQNLLDGARRTRHKKKI